MMEDGQARKQSFTSIQTRKLLGSLDGFHLCPSMDLAVYGTSTAHHQHHLYRTVSWQKVATIASMEDSIASASAPTTLNSADKTTSASPTCWSPNGRYIVVANGSNVSLYGVEPLANPIGGVSSLASGPTEAQHSWSVKHKVVGLSWAHVGRPHPTAWKSIQDEVEQEISWSYQSMFVDRSKTFLPPSAYLQPSEEEEHHRHQEHTTTTALPECETPLSVLCVSTTHTLELYLHGRYPLLTLPRRRPVPGGTTSLAFPSQQAVASNDLSYLLVFSEPHLSLYHLPFLKEDRYPLQIVAALHSSIMSHVSTLRASTTEILNSWKTCLKPLDMKIQPLLRLLQNYGVDDQSLGAILKQYILVGHTSESSSVANAMDQFFTGVQMNDQLLVRMVRTLHGSLASVESRARKGLLSPAQALAWEIQELAGLVQFHADGNPLALQALVDASHHLWISVEALMLAVVTSRFRIRDLCDWLRSAGSQIKARGTANNSVQRENATKRRVPQAVLERLLQVLNTTPLRNKKQPQCLTEDLLNLQVSELLKETESVVSLCNAGQSPPASPSSVRMMNDATHTVGFAVNQVQEATTEVFVNPLSNIPPSILPKDLVLPRFESSKPAPVAIHSRIGRDAVLDDPWEEETDEEDHTFFAPQAFVDGASSELSSLHCRQWAIVVQAYENAVQLYAFPLGWKESGADLGGLDDVDDPSDGIPFYLTTKLVISASGFVSDVGFYSDDGKSSLSSGSDSGTGKEGRQKLGVLYQNGDEVELWLLSYGSLQWQLVHFETFLLHPSQVRDECTTHVHPAPDTEDGEPVEGDNLILFAQTRVVSTMEAEGDSCKLLLCGSRGVGGLAVVSQGVTSLELLDLEEDEEGDEEFDEDED